MEIRKPILLLIQDKIVVNYMLQNLKQLYSIAVCFIATLVLMLMTGLMINNMTDLAFPEYKHKAHLNNFESNERYLYYKNHIDTEKKAIKWESLSEQSVSDLRIKEKNSYLSEKRGDAEASLINNLGWIVSCVFFLLLHWKIYGKTSK